MLSACLMRYHSRRRYGSGGFDKTQLKKIEQAGGLTPKGYIPVMRLGDEVIRESSVCVERVAQLSETLTPEDKKRADELISLCNTLPKSSSSRQLDHLLMTANAACAKSAYLAGDRFSIADACLLPFLQRVEDDFPSSVEHLRSYMARAHKLDAFSKTVMASWWWWW